MAQITIEGGGSIPEQSKTFTSDASPEGHQTLFAEAEAFIGAWKAQTAEVDKAVHGPAATESTEAATDT